MPHKDRQNIPTLRGTDRILFPSGTDMKQVIRTKCPTCKLNVACTGPKSAGGEIFSDLYTHKKVTEATIKADAHCFPKRSQ